MQTILGILDHNGIILADIVLQAQVKKKPPGPCPSGPKRIGTSWQRNGGPSILTFLHPMEQESLQKAHWEYVNCILLDDLDNGNKKSFWSYIKVQKQDNIGVSTLRKGHQLFSDSKSKAQLLSDYMVPTKPQPTPPPPPSLKFQGTASQWSVQISVKQWHSRDRENQTWS